MTTPERQPIALNVDELLTIDVGAELRKLAVAQFQGTWQLPTEFVRRALASAASRVDVKLSRQGFEVDDTGRTLSKDLLEHLAALLDTRQEATRRHRALLALEAEDAPSLLALGGLTANIEVGSGPWHLSATPTAVTLRAQPNHNGTRVRVAGIKLDHNRARQWLQSKCRYGPDYVYLHGESVATGLDAFLATRPLHTKDPRWQANSQINARELSGTVGMPAHGESARVVLLRHGVVATHVSVQNAPCFEAIIDVGPALTRATTAETLRAAIREWLEPLTDQAVELLHHLASQIERAGPRVRERILNLVLLAARRRQVLERLAELPVLPCLDPETHASTYISLAALMALSRQQRSPILALFPEQNPAHYTLAGNRVLVLDAATRGALGELLKIRFRTPALRRDGRRWTSRMRLFVGELFSISWLRRARTAVPESQLTRPERDFLSGLQAIAAGTGRGCPTEIAMCEGDGPPTRSGPAPGQLWLPRNNPDVRACIDAHTQKGDAWLYIGALALLDGKGLPSDSARGTWLRSWQSRGGRSR